MNFNRMPRFMKLQEFIAHSGTVHCAKIGRKSSGVLVTGGDDKKVNLWTIGTQNRTLSLAGHQSAVESVSFDTNEEVVAAGAQSGSIKLFDLEQAKVTKSLPGHRSNVTCLDFNSQFGLLSGSMDTNIKLWDIRCKDATVTCKGHTSCVRQLKFSPDGRWVASGSDKGEIKIHDLGSGRIIQEWNESHKNAITGLEFHPMEYLMATSSADKTVKVWDLDKMIMLSETPFETTGVRALAFHPDGRCLFSALQDGMRVWQWEPPPALQLDNVDVPWSKVADIAVMKDKNKLVGCSFNQSCVGLWVVDLKEVRPFANWPGDDTARSGSYAPGCAYPGGSYADSGTPNLQDYALRRGQYSSYDRNESPDRAMQRLALEDRRMSQGTGGARSSGAVSSSSVSDKQRYPSHGHSEVSTSMGQPVSASRQPSYIQPAYTPPVPPAPVSRNNSVQGAMVSPERGMPPRAPSGAPEPSTRGSSVSVGVGVGDSLFRGQSDAAVGLPQLTGSRGDVPPQPAYLQQRPGSQGRGSDQVWPGQGGMDYGRAGEARPSSRGGASGPAGGVADLDVIAEIVSKTDSMQTMLMSRLNAIRTIGGFIRRGDLRGAMTGARRSNDPAAAADALQAALQCPKFGNLITPDAMVELAPVLESILSLADEAHVTVAVDIGGIMCRAIIPWIRETLASGNARIIDLAAEQRRSKAEAARFAMLGLNNRYAFVGRQMQGTTLGSRAADIADQLSHI